MLPKVRPESRGMRSGRRPRVGLTGVRAVGAEGDLKGSIVMSFEDERLSLVLRASDPHGLIVISGDDAPLGMRRSGFPEPSAFQARTRIRR